MNSQPHSISMVNLVRQYQRYQTEIDAAMGSVLEVGDFIQGNAVKELESDLCQHLSVKHTITCGNGTDALQLAFMALDLPQGCEVIIPSFAYAALAEVVLLLGFVPVFAEVDPHTYLIDPDDIARKITEKTKAIAPVHLFGLVCNMDAILEIAQNRGLYVVEDAAQAIGAFYRGEKFQGFAGTLGTVGTTSFFPSKNLGCYGDGGAVFCSSDSLALIIRQLANHGQSSKYIHDIVGVNSRLDTLQAAVLRVKLKHLEAFNRARAGIADRYCAGLKELVDEGNLVLPQSNPKMENGSTKLSHVFHQFTLRLTVHEKREAFRQFLAQAAVPTMVYYPLPLHRQKAYFQSVGLTITENLCNSVLSLPICPELSVEEQDYIIATIVDFFKK